MNTIEAEWKKLLNKIVTTGEWVVKDDGDEILECIDNHCFIKNMQDNFYNLNLDLFLEMVDNGVFNITGYPIKDKALGGYVRQLNDNEQIYLEDDSFIYTYPERIFNVKQTTRTNEVVNINQFDVIVDRLREHSGSNRAVATLYIGALDKDEQHIPCLNWLQALIRDDKLSLHIMFRSNDLYSAFPSNMLFLMYLGLKLTKALKETYPSLEFKGIYYNSTSLHIYRGDYEQAKKVLGE